MWVTSPAEQATTKPAKPCSLLGQWSAEDCQGYLPCDRLTTTMGTHTMISIGFWVEIKAKN